jgi:hypothetical protein
VPPPEQLWATQVWGAVHAAHAEPPAPQALFAVPARHWPAEQQPAGHDVESHAHTSLTQCSPLPQLPLPHAPPQPSLAPQAFPAQLGVHPHVPLWPLPPHDSGALHVPPEQHG